MLTSLNRVEAMSVPMSPLSSVSNGAWLQRVEEKSRIRRPSVSDVEGLGVWSRIGEAVSLTNRLLNTAMSTERESISSEVVLRPRDRTLSRTTLQARPSTEPEMEMATVPPSRARC